VNPNIELLRKNSQLEWVQHTNERTGDIKEYTATFRAMTFEVKNNKYLKVSGSLHKHWNSLNGRGEKNYNDFRFMDLAGIIIQFCKTFDLMPDSCKLENIEFGVNVIPTIPTNEILRSAINFKGKSFNQIKAINRYSLECRHQRYYIKVYNKGLQNDLTENIFRFENKTVKMIQLGGIGIHSLSDLLNPSKVDQLGFILRNNFNDLLFYDYTIPETELSQRERLILTQGQIPAYWVNLQKTTPDNYYKKRQRFKDLIKKYGEQDIQEIVGCLISTKWNDLLKTDAETLRKLTDLENIGIMEINTSCKGLKPVMPIPVSCSPLLNNGTSQSRGEESSINTSRLCGALTENEILIKSRANLKIDQKSPLKTKYGRIIWNNWNDYLQNHNFL